MDNGILRVGIIGAGHIANKMALTLGKMSEATCLAVGARSLEKASSFASKWAIPRPYGSYDELFDDPDIDLVYIAVPNSLHFEVARKAMLKGKACLVEKPFMLNASQAREIISLSHERGIFVAEALYTRYLPYADIVRGIIASGSIGKVATISATLSYEMSEKERILDLGLGGGALLDLGVYGINFVRSFSGSPIAKISSLCTKFDSGPDQSASISIALEDGVVAHVLTSAICQGDNVGVIAGSRANIWLDDVNNPKVIRVYRKHHEVLQEHTVPPQISSFEYEIRESRRAIIEGKLETVSMPHSETLYVTEIMDNLRKEWGVVFPQEKP